MNTKLPNFGGTSSSGNDSKYFQTTKKGEIHELKEELANPKMEKKKEAVKKVIAAMTVGKDVVMLFTDVVNCIQTQNIELKKLVYLYLINYAKSQPDLAILAVNTFVKDTQRSDARAARQRRVCVCARARARETRDERRETCAVWHVRRRDDVPAKRARKG